MAKQGFFEEHWETVERDHAAGISSGRGWVIVWDADENDPPFYFAVSRYVIGAIIERIKFYQDGKFACEENKKALEHLQVAAQILGGLGGCPLQGKHEHWLDADENPAGGFSRGEGYLISWQNGPLGKIGTPERKEPNGAFVEDIIDAVLKYLGAIHKRFENIEVFHAAAEQLEKAGEVMDSRTKRRTEAKTEGTHEGN